MNPGNYRLIITDYITPLEQLAASLLSEKKVRLFIKREDLIHPYISGNKWRKLKYNLIKANHDQKTTLLTFGGAFSNHIYAVAAAGKEFGFKTIGIIRGERIVPFNPILSFAVSCGMELNFIAREEYIHKEEPDFIRQLRHKLGDFYLLPEGGTNILAVKGCAEVVCEISIDYDYLCCPCGTGGTLAGLIAGANGKNMLLGFSVLKGMNDLEEKIESLVNDFSGNEYFNWSISHDYHFGGYARVNKTLLSFIDNFKKCHNMGLDTVYMGKMMFGIYNLIQNDFFKPNSTIVALNTGGLY
jgi:1-aminocyclopropane-1-carboxylate deaminase/D-cysteine desulfhydrase-like pyridoxal-dependent ACC family enzyme